MLVKSLLELIGTTTSSLEALATIEEGNVDLVFMDIQMQI
jgi:CheY-like chemotaxis protein